MMLFAVLVALASPHANAAPPSAEQYYAQALAAMNALPQPAYATYDTHVHVTGAGFVLSRQSDGESSIGLIVGGRTAKPDATFGAVHRRSDDLTALKTPQGWAFESSPIFDPTWTGVDDWMRYGVYGRPKTETPAPTPAPEPNGLKVIAAVRAMGVALYRVVDEGGAMCASGDPGHRVHLIAYRDPLRHPLTDAVIDERTDHLCFVRFGLHQSIVAAGYDATIELNIDDVGGYSLVRSGKVTLTGRVAGFAVKSITMHFTYDRLAFPAALPTGTFPPKPAP